MKRIALFVLLASRVVAGPVADAEIGLAPAAKDPWLVPSFDIRMRYEYGDVDAPGLGNATAWTIRERAGLKLGPFAGFTMFAEYEGTQALDDHYVTPFPTSPGPGPRTVIADPESSGLNQAWLEWAGFDSSVRAGRQRIIMDNAAFIGNVGWRQNEQTYDGVLLQTAALDDFRFQYAWINRVNRIFGSDATGAVRNFAGDTHLLNANWKPNDSFQMSGYIYLMDFDETGAAFSNNTYGLWAETSVPLFGDWSGKLHTEAAWQTDASSTPVDYSAFYGHVFFAASHETHKVTLGYEHLGEDLGTSKATGAPAPISFRTPLATAHAFNGFADAFLGARIGGTPGGIGDLYVSYSTMLPAEIKFLAALHWFGEDDFEFGHGWEADLVLSRKFGEYFTAIAKVAVFDSAGGVRNPAPFDTVRASLEANFKY